MFAYRVSSNSSRRGDYSYFAPKNGDYSRGGNYSAIIQGNTVLVHSSVPYAVFLSFC